MIFSTIYFPLVTESGATHATSNILMLCCLILLDTLSNIIEFRLATFRDLVGLNSTSPNSPSGKFPSVRGENGDDPRISISMGSGSCASSCFLLISSSSLFLCASCSTTSSSSFFLYFMSTIVASSSFVFHSLYSFLFFSSIATTTSSYFLFYSTSVFGLFFSFILFFLCSSTTLAFFYHIFYLCVGSYLSFSKLLHHTFFVFDESLPPPNFLTHISTCICNCGSVI
jgi:hypothetical protein